MQGKHRFSQKASVFSPKCITLYIHRQNASCVHIMIIVKQRCKIKSILLLAT